MSFEFGTSARIIFGWGEIARLPDLAAEMGRRALIVTGGRSFEASGGLTQLEEDLKARGLASLHEAVGGEPTVERVDAIVAAARGFNADVVIAIGGGSAMDAAKAIAAVITNSPPGVSVREFLEGVGVGRKVARHPLRMIAVPTTSGTGSEVTKNAVLRDEAHTFKKSMRHHLMRPEIALVDPELTLTAPPEIKAASGMDALTQLIEAEASAWTRQTPESTFLARPLPMNPHGVPFFLREAIRDPSHRLAHEVLASWSLASGVALDNFGLGAVHGLASPLGAFFDVPHGVVCANLLPEVTEANLARIRMAESDEQRNPYALWMIRMNAQGDDAAFIAALAQLRTELAIPRLSTFGIRRADIPRIVAASRGGSMKTNAVLLSDEELAEILAKVIDED